MYPTSNREIKKTTKKIKKNHVILAKTKKKNETDHQEK